MTDNKKVCISPLATRPVLYTDTIKGGQQALRDDLWAVTTDELNELELARRCRAQGGSTSEKVSPDLAAPTTPAQVPAAEVRAAYEKAAKACDEICADYQGHANRRGSDDDEFYDAYMNKSLSASECAAAIRSLAQSSTADKASEVRAADWISVEDRLPEENAEVLICGDRRHDEGKYQAVSKYSRGFFFDDDHNEDGEYINVTHWRNLPAAPSTADSGNTVKGQNNE